MFTIRSTEFETQSTRSWHLLAGLLTLFCTLSAADVTLAQEIETQDAQPSAATKAEFSDKQLEFFEKQVRPLLINRCYKCHSGEKEQGGLRLDSRAAVVAGGDSGPSIDVDDPAKSMLLEAISYAPDAIVEMPPDGRLSQAEVDIFKRWVLEGMPWPNTSPDATAGNSPAGEQGETFSQSRTEFWSFQPISKPEIPQPKNKDWSVNPIDQFILSKLEQSSLTPAPAADKRTLIRRATFDLTGLPPTPADVEAFLADGSPTAFAKVIDRLLGSAQYGERWGRHWLDVARFADSNGMDENLSQANAFRYRDYIIRSFNNDKPFDRLIQEQLAGDLLTDAADEQTKIDQLIATGFLSLGPKMLAEDDPLKMQMDIVDEQIDTIGKGFMGLTLGCARCHDHKFDPVSTADYYALAGIFKSTKTMDNFKVVAQWHERPAEPADVVVLFNEYEKKRDGLQAEIDAITTAANQQFSDEHRPRVVDYMLAATEKLFAEDHLTSTVQALNASNQPEFAGQVQRLARDFDRGNVDRFTQSTEPLVEVIGTYKQGISGAEYDFKIPEQGQYALFLRYAAAQKRPLSLSVDGQKLPVEVADDVTGKWDLSGQRWFYETTVELKAGVNVVRLECQSLFPHVQQLLLVPIAAIEGKPASQKSAWPALATQGELNPALLQQWADYLKESRSDNKSIFAPWHRLNASLSQSLSEIPAEQTLVGELAQESAAGSRAAFIARYKEKFLLAETAWQTAQQVDTQTPPEMLPDEHLEAFRQVLYGDKGPFRLPETVGSYYPPEVANRLASKKGELAEVNKSAPSPLQFTMAVTDGEIENAQICIRGNHINLGDEVPRRFLEVVQTSTPEPSISEETSGRLELAQWLTSPEHPLTSRVIANRVWRWHFGTGLVKTVDNFGLTGDVPVHRELLDWLAGHLMDNGWSLKKLHRTIMLSSTYQMSSAFNSTSAEIDLENRLWWRHPRKRLEAEAIRDAVLAVAGTIDFSAGGSMLKVPNRNYVASTASNLTVEFNNARRSVYQPVIRSALYEMFQSFDFPDPSALQGDRPTTTIAPQALFMLNSPFMEEHSAALAKRLFADSDDQGTRIRSLYLLAYSRPPTEIEVTQATEFLQTYRQQIEQDDQIKVDEQELAIWRGLCRAILSSSEFVYVE